jgi:iron(III) transport system ATP-binding protein
MSLGRSTTTPSKVQSLPTSAGKNGSAVDIENLTVGYEGVTAVRDLDLRIEEGEMLVLLGPSGCGKTSTLRSVAGLEAPTRGRITVGHDVVFDSNRGIVVPPNKRRIGMVFQSYAVWPHMTVAQNVGFPLKMQRKGKAEIRSRVEEVLDLVGLSGMGHRGASRLSGGQMQRVALARSLAMQPSVLLLDEPLSNLDAKLRERLRFELRDVQQRIGITSIYVTHDQSEALALADRVAVMSQGRIEQLDRPDVVYSEPASRQMADFLGVENIFRGTVVERRADGLAEASLAGTACAVAGYGSQPVGTQVDVCFRSEGVELVTGPTEIEDDVWPGSLESVNFLGAQWRYRIELDIGPVLEGTSAASTPPGRTGDRARVRVRPGLVRLLERDPDPPAAQAVGGTGVGH